MKMHEPQKRPFFFPFNGNQMASVSLRLGSPSARGAFFQMMPTYLTDPSLFADDDEVLSELAGMTMAEFRRVKSRLLRFYRVIDGKWRCPVLDEMREKAYDVMSKRSVAGKKGAAARWPKEEGGQ